ncbi:MAG: FKBP-type peptidyl-prolyl cis-trans isomerase [Pseudomonadota bacterium]|nr:FKBP-type peptidyl-prolyl cis-trans isomerase [Pseudomonadota bacterium]
MTEITRVPLQPIAKGSLTKLWFGILAAIVFGAGLAWAAIPQGLDLEELTAGSGAMPGPSDVVFVRYKGTLPDGTVFDESQDIPLPVQGIFPEGTPLPLDRMLPAFSEGVQQMQPGGTYRLTIPGDQGYGAEPPPGSPIPPNSPLIFEVELIESMSTADFEQRLQALQQTLQMQQGGAPGAPGAPGAEEGAAPPPPPAPAR